MTSRVFVHVMEGKNLMAADGLFKKTSSDPFVKITSGKQSKKTKHIMKTLNPVWNETLVLEFVDVFNIEQKTLLIECYDWDKLKRNDKIGHASVLLTDFKPRDKAKELELDLIDGGNGKLKLSIRVERMTDAKSAAKIANDIAEDLKARRMRFEDKDFPPDDRSIYKDAAKHTKTAEGTWTSTYDWKRLLDVCGGEKEARVFVDGSSSGDVVQGALGDCFLLGALAVCAARPLISPLFVTSMPQLGLFQIRFFKDRWHVVTIDDFVPCPKGKSFNTGEAVPVYGRCKDKREMWLALVEKAYAKLHGSYEAIESGSIAAALIDITGEGADAIDIAKESGADKLDDLWKRLRHASDEGFMMGTSCSKGGSEEKLDNGILAGHAYALLQCLDEKDAAGLPLRLMKLYNPWGNTEFNGAYSDHSKDWTPALIKKLGVKFGDDGTFYMKYQDYVRVFTNIWILRLLTDPKGKKWYRYEISGEWNARSAGGCSNNAATFGNNPQFGIAAKFANTQLYVSLLQPDKRMSGEEAYKQAIGISAFRVKAPPAPAAGAPPAAFRRVAALGKADATSVYAPERSVSLEFGPLGVGERAIIVPATFDAKYESKFTLLVFSSTQLGPIEELLSTDPIVVKGAWTDKTAGGCVNHETWSNNPQFKIKSDIAADVTLKLIQASRDEPLYIGLSVGKGAKPSKDTIKEDPACTNTEAIAVELALAANEEYWLMPQTFTPGETGSFELHVFVHTDKANVVVV